MDERQARAAFPAAFVKACGGLRLHDFGGSFHLHMAHVMRGLVDDPAVDPAIKRIAFEAVRAHVDAETKSARPDVRRPFTNLFPEIKAA